ncbi:MAG TPA: endonuclease/exonuclease/phosphatase family protein [Burkholderiaceae bacterium]|nr:endonuclease/exonuclease/phosphatase family protein [Burkholderiaceae bacterium]
MSNAQAGNFAVNCQIPSATLGTITIRRGWAAVDAKIRGKSFRFISTHLDGDCLPATSAIQQAQAAELLQGPAVTPLPVVLVGDLNSPANGTGVTYNRVIAAGFSDAAALAGIGATPTCCQADNLLNPVSLLDRRIDFVLFRGQFSVQEALVVGNDPIVRTPSGLWPSDHAGVVSTLGLPHP